MLCMLTKTQASFRVCIDVRTKDILFREKQPPSAPNPPLRFTILLPVRPPALVPVRSRCPKCAGGVAARSIPAAWLRQREWRPGWRATRRPTMSRPTT